MLAVAAIMLVAVSFAWFKAAIPTGSVNAITANAAGSEGGTIFSLQVELYNESTSAWDTLSGISTLDTSMLIPGKEFRYRITVTPVASGTMSLKLTNMECDDSFVDDGLGTDLYPTLAPYLSIKAINSSNSSTIVEDTLNDLMDTGSSTSATVIQGVSVTANTPFVFEYRISLFGMNTSLYDGSKNSENSALMGEFIHASFKLYIG